METDRERNLDLLVKLFPGWYLSAICTYGTMNVESGLQNNANSDAIFRQNQLIKRHLNVLQGREL
jgi:hypothetical protein